MKPAVLVLIWALGSAGAVAGTGSTGQETASQEAPAQESSAPQPPAAQEAEAPGADAQGGAAEPTRDLFDVLREWRHKPPPPPPGPEDYKKRMRAFAPVVSYGPTSGFGLGLAGNEALFRGHPATTSISSAVVSAIATTKGQVLVNVKIAASSAHDNWVLSSDNRLYWTSQSSYGLGTGSSETDAFGMEFDYFRFYETLSRRVYRRFYLGAGLLYSHYTNVGPEGGTTPEAWPETPYVQYSEKYGFDPASQTSSGLSLTALVDSRDGAINPSRGWLVRVTYRMFFEGFLGGDSSWQQLSYDLRTYRRLVPDARHKLTFWLSGDLGAGGTAPYMDLPATAMDTYGRAGRGYPQGRFRGDDLAYGEAEYRWTLSKSGLFGIVAFVNAQTFGNEETGERVFDALAIGGGIGLRVMLNKRSRTNLCLDIGRGEGGAKAVYFGVQEAF